MDRNYLIEAFKFYLNQNTFQSLNFVNKSKI